MILITLMSGFPSFLFCSYLAFKSASYLTAVNAAKVNNDFIFLFAKCLTLVFPLIRKI